MSKRKLSRRILIALLLIVVGANIIAFNHAWRFTHYSYDAHAKTEFEHLSFTDQVKYGLLGVENPRPVNKSVPRVPYETLTIPSNEQLECWWLETADAKGTVLIFHGYMSSKTDMLQRAYIIQAEGYNILLVDMMGTAGSTGNEVTIGYREAQNVKDCYNYIKETQEGKIVLFGTSMGAAALTKAIRDYGIEPDGVIMEAMFATMFEAVTNRFDMVDMPYFPMAHLLVMWGGWQHGFWAFGHNPKEYVQHITCPALVIYGAKDMRVKKSETMEIYNNLPGHKQLAIYPEAKHARYLGKYRAEWTNDIKHFLDDI